MGNNDEIRKRMETYQNVLLVSNWIVSIALVIAGFVMMDLIGGLAFIIVIIAIILGIIGHFMVNVVLAIPFILLNNGDYLVAIVPEGKIIKNTKNSTEEKTIEEQIQEIKKGPNDKQNELKIVRLNDTFGSGILLEVIIDNEMKFTIKNGEEKIVKISNGKHIIKVSRDNDYDKKEFEINNNGKIFSIVIGPPIKINIE